jgi:hypothetical protein
MGITSSLGIGGQSYLLRVARRHPSLEVSAGLARAALLGNGIKHQSFLLCRAIAKREVTRAEPSARTLAGTESAPAAGATGALWAKEIR